jgi:hypothetical protein
MAVLFVESMLRCRKALLFGKVDLTKDMEGLHHQLHAEGKGMSAAVTLCIHVRCNRCNPRYDRFNVLPWAMEDRTGWESWSPGVRGEKQTPSQGTHVRDRKADDFVLASLLLGVKHIRRLVHAAAS